MCTFPHVRSNRNEFITKQKKNFTINVSKCPLCKAPIGTGAAIHVNIALDDIIGNFDVNCKSSGCLWTGHFREHEQYFKICEKTFNAVCKWRVQRGSGKGEDGSAHFPKCKAEGRCQGNVSKSMLLPSVSKRITCPLSCGTSLSR